MMRTARWIFATAALAHCSLLALATACGDPQSSTPSPEAIATAESIAIPATFTAAFALTPTRDEEDEEAIILDARVFGDGEIGVILAHMRPSDQSSWYPFATELAATGDFTVLTFDFRGYGDSTGDKQFDRIDADLSAAYEYMDGTLGVSKIFLVGASMGGTASLVVAAHEDVAGVVSISSPGQFPPLDANETVDEIAEPKLFITAEDDVPAMRSLEMFWELAPEPKSQQIYDGDDHGTALLDSEHGADLKARILGFIRSN